jgi:aarF domain-containing kinase
LTLISNSFTTFWYNLFLTTLRWGGPTFIKLGQWMATRSDLFDTEFCCILADLHSYGSIHSFKETKYIIEKNYNKKLEEMFTEFSETPIASGAIAQVYKGRIITNDEYNGKNVAIKIKHPGIDEKITLDLKLISYLAKGVNFF